MSCFLDNTFRPQHQIVKQDCNCACGETIFAVNISWKSSRHNHYKKRCLYLNLPFLKGCFELQSQQVARNWGHCDCYILHQHAGQMKANVINYDLRPALFVFDHLRVFSYLAKQVILKLIDFIKLWHSFSLQLQRTKKNHQ